MASQDEMRRARNRRFGDGSGGGGGGGGWASEDGSATVNQQPTRESDMAAPPRGAQLGLKHLDQAEYLFVQQDVEHFEAMTGFETENSYKTYNSNGQQIYEAKEESSILCRCLCKNNRSFLLHLVNYPDQSVFLEIERPLRFIYQTLLVRDSNGIVLGSVERMFTFFSRDFIVRDAEGKDIYIINGRFFNPWTFKIIGMDGVSEVGIITKEFPKATLESMMREFFTDADNFGVQFYKDRNIPKEHKAVLYAAVFLIDYMYFEDNSGQQQAKGFMSRR